jgi:hypothetical protein
LENKFRYHFGKDFFHLLFEMQTMHILTCYKRKKEKKLYFLCSVNYKSQSSLFATPFLSPGIADELIRARKQRVVIQFFKNFAQVDVKIEAEEAKKHKDSDKVIAMTDVDPHYFTELSGRSVKEKFSLEQYIQDIREILKIKLLVGQEKDDCICIDQQFEQETRRLRKIQV